MATLTAEDMIDAGWAVLTRQWAWLLGGGVIVAAVQGVQQLARPQVSGGGAVAALILAARAIQFLGHGLIARQVMEVEGLVQPGAPPRYIAYVLTSLVFMVGVALASLLLIVPGMLLLQRWFLSTNLVLARGMNVFEALAASGEATRGHRGPILGAWVVMWVVVGAPYGLLAWSVGLAALGHVSPLSAIGLLRLTWEVVSTAISLALSIGVYSVLGTRTNTLTDVFS